MLLEDADIMSVTLTSSGGPGDHPRELLKTFSIDNNTVNIICSDGQLSSSILLLASVSPIIRQIGRQQHICDCQDISLLLPDFRVQEIQQFICYLTSENGPLSQEDQSVFTELLLYFGQTLDVQDLKKEASDSDEEWAPNDDTEQMEYEQAEDEEQEENVSSFAPKRPNFKKTGKFSDEVLSSYDESRRLFVCQICGTERKRSDRLAHHLQWHQDHPGETYQTRNNCKICGRFNATYFMLKMHMSRMHSDLPKEFHCPHEGCSKSFRFKGELKIHGLTHSKERNFVCSECGERFRSKGQVELHAIRRHNPDTKPTIPCEECGKLFRIQADLRNHLSRTHRARQERKHRCLDCDLTFRSEKSLLSHMALHDPERPLQCSRCTLRYKNKDALVAHEKTHDNAQYSCEFCTIAFKRKDNLKRHIRSKHQSMSMIDKLMLNDQQHVNNQQLLIPHT